MSMPFLSGADAYQAEREFREHENSKVALNQNKSFLEFKGNELHWNFHYGQMRAMQSKKRFINCLASRQSGKCVSVGSLVLIGDGSYMPIELIKTGMQVLSYDEHRGHLVPQFVTHTWNSGVKDCWRSRCEGISATTTKEHRFLTENGYKRLQTLATESQEVLLINHAIKNRKIERVDYAGKMETYDIEVANTHNFIIKDPCSLNTGFIVHNSEVGPPWLYEEMRVRGPGNYMIVAPSYPLLEASALPKFTRLFVDILKLGKMRSKPLRFELSEAGEQHLWGHKQSSIEKTVVAFGHGANPQSLEARSAVKGVWVDEGGQPLFKRASFEALEGRTVTVGGRLLITSTPYTINHLKTHYYDPWEQSGGDHPDIDVIQWESCANPNFPRSEFERLRNTMPEWRFLMFYCGKYSMPSGLIYDIVANNPDPVVVKAFSVPEKWPRYVGIDFGGMNTLALYAALDPETMTAYIYKEYYPQQQYAIAHHAKSIMRLSEGNIEAAFGGAKAEGQWREEFIRSGLYVQEPQIAAVDVGIARVYNLLSQNRLKIMESAGRTDKINNEIYEYRYETDPDTGEVLPDMKIVSQNSFHAMDAMRYLGGGLGFLLNGQVFEVGMAGGDRYDRKYIPQGKTRVIGADTGIAVVGGSKSSQYMPSRSDMMVLSKLRPF